MSSLTRTKSPTTNCDEDPVPDAAAVVALEMGADGDVIESEDKESTLSDVSDEPDTFVKIAGLKVHLKAK